MILNNELAIAIGLFELPRWATHVAYYRVSLGGHLWQSIPATLVDWCCRNELLVREDGRLRATDAGLAAYRKYQEEARAEVTR